MTGLSPLVLELIIVLMAIALLWSFRVMFKLAWFKVRLAVLRMNVDRLEALSVDLTRKAEQAKWRAKHNLPPAA